MGIFVDERHSLEKDPAFRHAPVPDSILQEVINHDLRLLRKPEPEWFPTTSANSTQRSAGTASGTQSLISRTFNPPVPPRRAERYEPSDTSSESGCRPRSKWIAYDGAVVALAVAQILADDLSHGVRLDCSTICQLRFNDECERFH